MRSDRPSRDELAFFRDLGFRDLYIDRAGPETAALVPGALTDLPALSRFLEGCPRCKLSRGRTHIVFGQGNPKADLMFVGEAPGHEEDVQGLAFVGRAGQLLTRIIEAMGRKREDVFICNVLKCRPPNNRNPEPDEVASCIPFLEEQIRLIAPRVIVTLGTFAAQAVLGTDEPIGRLRGRWRSARGVRIMPTFHPAFLLRSPERKKDVWEDMKLVRDFLASEKS
ncbi:MAG TPA: uracil-DNA glycosylase [Thermoanaerobaculia bacterium]|nr:uracil-DNA glycosylase [Thermoanaerobaculia bacterium]